MNLEKLADIGRRAKEEGIPRLRKIHQYYFQCLDLIDTLENQKYKAEQLKDRDLVVRNKHAKRIARTVKKINQLFKVIDQAFIRGEIKEFEGEAFALAIQQATKEGISSISRPTCATCHIQRLKPLAGTASKARKELSKLDTLVLLYEDYENTRKLLNKRIKELRRKIHDMEIKMRELQKIKEDLNEIPELEEQLRNYKRLLDLLKKYDDIRREKLTVLVNKPLSNIVTALNLDNRADTVGFPRPENSRALEELSEIVKKDCPEMSPPEILECLKYNEKKLSHITPEPNKLKQLISENYKWLLGVSTLPDSDFLKLKPDTPISTVETAGSFLKVDKKLIDEIIRLIRSINPDEVSKAIKLSSKLHEVSMNALKKEWKESRDELDRLLQLSEEYW